MYKYSVCVCVCVHACVCVCVCVCACSDITHLGMKNASFFMLVSSFTHACTHTHTHRQIANISDHFIP